MIKETLKHLCRNNGWSYGVLWRYDPTNSSLLTLQQAYHEEQMGTVIEDMLLQVHVLGRGAIGQASFRKTHGWTLLDVQMGIQSPAGSVRNSNTFQDYSGLEHQLSAGIKTIAVISVEPLGVVQFGSTQKLPESLDFVCQTREVFHRVQIVQGCIMPESGRSFSNSDTCGTSGPFDLMMSGDDYRYFLSPNLQHGDLGADLTETIHSFPSTSYHENMECVVTASLQCNEIFGTSIAEAKLNADYAGSSIQTYESFSKSDTSSKLYYQGLHNSKWSSAQTQESPYLDPRCRSGLIVDTRKMSEVAISPQNSGLLLHSGEAQIQSPGSLRTLDELSQNDGFFKAFSECCPTDGLLQWFPPTINPGNETLATAFSDVQTWASGGVALTSNLKGQHTPSVIISDSRPSTSAQCSNINTVDCVEKEKCPDNFCIDKLFDGSGLDDCSRSTGNFTDILMPFLNGGRFDFCASASECISELHDDPKQGSVNNLLSKPGRDQHLSDLADGNFGVAKSDFDDRLSSTAKRRKVESSLPSCNQVKYLHDFPGHGNPLQCVYNSLNSTNNLRSKDIKARTMEPGSYSSDNCSTIAETAISTPRSLEQLAKSTKQKAKPGTKPRPKDRQQIHERLLQLRELIPDGEKMSIDRLLHRTIKNLLFLQSVAKHAENFQRNNDLKSGVIHKDKPRSSNGVTWACEVGSETMFCPLIIEELSIPGQMLIEILCEEQGFFLEIVDVIRGFGLTIMKGVMEVRDAKIWARFTVETEENRRVTRHEVFTLLVQMLQLSGSAEVNKSARVKCNTIDGGGAAVVKTCTC